ncbi:hypothetical protein Y032_0175g505 [Ancylostoma ceylanicum]|uniref:Uncharacterized protein n=1 Tax=Ancylostoma ceylanicum TaxID=53326 RepID=A0A016SUQ3_9BILA|nr:hypothetical protein Y032_0175g505 [Ancylostoma ceylanicum]
MKNEKACGAWEKRRERQAVPSNTRLSSFGRQYTENSKRPAGYGAVPRCASFGQRLSESMIKALSVVECARQPECHTAPRHWSASIWPFGDPCDSVSGRFELNEETNIS